MGLPWACPPTFLGLTFSSVTRGSTLKGCLGSPDSGSGRPDSVCNDCSQPQRVLKELVLWRNSSKHDIAVGIRCLFVWFFF